MDMSLASRLSMQANLGNLMPWKEVTRMVIGNVALVQVQAITAAFLISCYTMGIGWAVSDSFKGDHFLLLITASIFTATSSCFVLGKLSINFDYLYEIINNFISC